MLVTGQRNAETVKPESGQDCLLYVGCHKLCVVVVMRYHAVHVFLSCFHRCFFCWLLTVTP